MKHNLSDAKLKGLLEEIRTAIRSIVPAELFKDDGTWIHYHRLVLLRAMVDAPTKSISRHQESFSAALLADAQKLLAPLADDARCRSSRKVWNNTGYCPDTPYGDYWWVFTVQMVQQLVWLYPEFVEGFRYGARISQHADGRRAANPYAEPSRASSWDTGYTLGLTQHYEPENIRAWLDARKPLAAAA